MVGRAGGQLRAHISAISRDLDVGGGDQTLKVLLDGFPPMRPHVLNVLRQCHQPEMCCSNTQYDEDISHLNSHAGEGLDVQTHLN